MSALVTTDRLDHVHLNVTDRAASAAWFARVLGLRILGDTDPDANHPLFLAPANSTHLCLSLFTGDPASGPNRNIAFHANATDFVAFASQLPHPDVTAKSADPLTAADVQDYGMAMNFDFVDPDGNHVELVTYDCAAARAAFAKITP